MTKQKIIGPFAQLLTFRHLPLAGPLADDQLEILTDGCVLVENGLIKNVGSLTMLREQAPGAALETITTPQVLLPGFVDSHTHICFAGNRSLDHALRLAGKSYLEIAKAGGGILDTVRATRAASEATLVQNLVARCQRLRQSGVTTVEVKSGYGLSLADEIKMLRAIQNAQKIIPIEIVSTCLAAHTLPPEFAQHQKYLDFCLHDILPQVRHEKLSGRVDIFIEDGAFEPKLAQAYLKACQTLGFEITVHADQFTTGATAVACDVAALSADHLEVSRDEDFARLAQNHVVATVLPLSSLGLGLPFARARQILDVDATLAIASDWNPGSAPHGDLLTGASCLATNQKLTHAETLAGITFRAAHALGLSTRGRLQRGWRADFVAFPASDFRDILYYQGSLRPSQTWVSGFFSN